MRRAATSAAAAGFDPVSSRTAIAPSKPSVATNGGKTVRQIAIDEIDGMIHHLQQTKQILAAFPVVE